MRFWKDLIESSKIFDFWLNCGCLVNIWFNRNIGVLFLFIFIVFENN